MTKAIITFEDSILEASANEITMFQAMGIAFDHQLKVDQKWEKIELYVDGVLVDRLNQKKS